MGAMSDITSYFQDVYDILVDSLYNNIIIIAIMLFIYLYISADKAQAFTYADIFVFMAILTNPAPCKRKTEPQTGGSVAGQLSEAASSVNNAGKAINTFTASVKKDVDYERYMDESLGKFKGTYCNDMDTMSMTGAFFYTMHSSFLACYNAIQLFNVAIIKLINLELGYPHSHYGILILYVLFILAAMASSKFFAFLMGLMHPSSYSSDTYSQKIMYAILSAVITIFYIYVIIAVVAYITFLTYALFNIKSEQSQLIFQITIFAFVVLIPIISLPSMVGFNII
jgi:hypothetical protein